jgi:cytochrome oxidase assembly protein ShyY1
MSAVRVRHGAPGPPPIVRQPAHAAAFPTFPTRNRGGLTRTPYRNCVLRTLRQPRYAALGVLMVVIAAVCVAAGTWQIARFDQKVHENDDLRANAHAAVAQVADVLPIVGRGRAPSSKAVEFRPVRVTGSYDAAAQSLVRSRTVGDKNGFLVLTPLRTTGGTLLVVRGFVAQPSSGRIPAANVPPAGTVTVMARVQGPESRHDAAADLGQHQVESINPGEQAERLTGPVYNGYAQLEAHQAGSTGLKAIPAPDLSNPAGGALEPQHFAYVIQWYLFALLALAAPFAMARAETKHRPVEQFDEAIASASASESASELGKDHAAEPSAQDVRAAKLADRYGRVR